MAFLVSVLKIFLGELIHELLAIVTAPKTVAKDPKPVLESLDTLRDIDVSRGLDVYLGLH